LLRRNILPKDKRIAYPRCTEKKMTDIYPGLGEQILKKIKNYDVIKILNLVRNLRALP